MRDNKFIKFIILTIINTSLFLFCSYSFASQEVKIIIKVDNSIITSTDINDETNYLKALNQDLGKLKKADVYKIAKDSLIREKIKQNEIEKLIDIQNFKNDKLINDIIKNIYTRLGFKNITDFEIYLNTFNLS